MTELPGSRQSERAARTYKTWVLAAIALAGLLLILAAIALPKRELLDLPRELLRELGIAVLAVFTVSYIYEEGLSKKYMAQFIAQLRSEITKGEGNAATCAVLGIDEIFRDRLSYERSLGIALQLRDADANTRVRLVARSAFTVVGHAAERLRQIIKAGAHVEICILDPRISDADMAWNVDVTRADIRHTLALLQEIVVPELVDANAVGELSVALHRVPLLESFLLISHAAKRWCTWDFSFGRDPSCKNVLMLDPQKPLGVNVCARYDHVWKHAEKIVTYKSGKLTMNRLSEFLTVSAPVDLTAPAKE